MSAGKMELWHGENIVATCVYKDTWHKEKALNVWKKRYGPLFKIEFVRDQPKENRYSPWKPKPTKDERNDFDNAILR